MAAENLIPINEFCSNYHIEISFINSLQQFGLIEITNVQERLFISAEQLPQLEQMAHLHYELDINPEGIDAINHLLQRVKNLQHEITALQNKLLLYENG